MMFLCVMLVSFFASAQGVFGHWKTIDDETGKAKSIVEIYKGEDGKLYGKILRLLDPTKKGMLCSKCEGEYKDNPVKGMVVVKGLEKSDDKWEGGTILDPKKGKVYDCKLWIDEENPNRLNVRGYILFFYRTQHWERVLDKTSV